MKKRELTKAELIRLLAAQSGSTLKQARAFINALPQLAISQTQKTGEFSIPKFGRLTVTQRRGGAGRNPQTGESIRISPRTEVKFHVARELREAAAVGNVLAVAEGAKWIAKKASKESSSRKRPQKGPYPGPLVSE